MSEVTRPGADPSAGWPAELALRLERRQHGTLLTEVRHQGPLRIQRPFHPEGPEVPHLYLLHPPGGLVAGDALAIKLELAAAAQALVTTPAAAKIYGVGARALPQRQTVEARVAAGAVLEWLPQESIVFNGASVTLDADFRLSGDAGLLAWEILTLGRQAGEAPFRDGSVRQRIRVWRDNRPLLDETLRIAGDSPILTAHWGLGGQPVLATLVVTAAIGDAMLSELRALASAAGRGARWSATRLPALTVARYLGPDAREALALCIRAWSLLRPLLCGREARPPRIWAT